MVISRDNTRYSTHSLRTQYGNQAILSVWLYPYVILPPGVSDDGSVKEESPRPMQPRPAPRSLHKPYFHSLTNAQLVSVPVSGSRPVQ
ncbi:hypothetical protein J6590_011973 [Homalodisca vitripennis]|nr:hypothetical protein J6590_011973 [Homalodisca vitripennis]